MDSTVTHRNPLEGSSTCWHVGFQPGPCRVSAQSRAVPVQTRSTAPCKVQDPRDTASAITASGAVCSHRHGLLGDSGVTVVLGVIWLHSVCVSTYSIP